MDKQAKIKRAMHARIKALEARVAAADKLAERSLRIIDGYGFTADGNDTWREVAAVDIAELETALAAYQATKEGEA
jgi:hypothetical protein